MGLTASCSLVGLADGQPDAGGGEGVGATGAGASMTASGSGAQASGGAGGVGGLGPSNEIWAEGFGDENDTQEGSTVAVDRTCVGGGCVVVAGYFSGNIDFGGGLLSTTTTPGDADVFVAKLDAAGKHLWSAHFGDDREQRARSVAVGADGHVILVGWFKGAIDFGAGELTTKPTYKADAFVAKLDAAGALVWAKQYGGSAGADGETQQAESVAIDAAGNVFVAGIFDGKIDFGGMVHQASTQDIFLAKLGPDGARLWSKSWDGTDGNNAPNVAVDAQGDVLFAGNFGQTLDLGCMPALAAGGDDDIFVAKLSGVDGSCVWDKQFGDGSTAQFARGIAAASNGDAVVLCELTGAIDFGGETLSGIAKDVAVARLAAADGKHVWSLRTGDPSDQMASALAVDPGSGAVYALGSFLQSISFDPAAPRTKLVPHGQEDIYLAKLDATDGHLVWNERFGDFASDFGRGLAIDGAGALFTTGRFRGTVDFGKTKLTSVNSQGDVFLAKHAPSAPE